MKHCLRFGALVLSLALGVDLAAAQTRAPDGLPPTVGAVTPANPAQLQLTPAQKTAILNAVREKSANVRPSPTGFPVAVGEMVPPSIELYLLPDNALAEVPEAKAVKYTVVQNQVVLVDPTTMRIIDVLR
jgi:Protein of unknown function (DUF1236)